MPPPPHRVPVVLTIAGSDSGGGAGIQADLKTFAALRVFGASAITCLTAQKPDEVMGVWPAPPAFIRRQIQAVCRGFPIAAVKTGMLYSAAIIRAVAAEIKARRLKNLVVDPVMVATSGARLLRADAVQALQSELLPLARIVTPNLPEAEILAGMTIRSLDDMVAAARILGRKYRTAWVIKGGHRRGRKVTDVLCYQGRIQMLETPRAPAGKTHGTGCTYAAALAAYLAVGRPLPEAVRGAQQFVGAALAVPLAVGRHHPLNIAGFL